MDEESESTPLEADDNLDVIADLDPGDGADEVIGGMRGGDPCDGSELHTH
jgi:hypothetical protein